MQIHELNNRRPVNEIDLVGPTSIFNVGKQVLKNPKAFINSAELGAAEKAANQASAASSAEKLSNPGAVRQALGARTYNVGAGAKPNVTTAQQLQTVKSNPAVQSQVKNLSSQWKAQSAQIRKATKPVTEDTKGFNPRDVTNPTYASVLQSIQSRDAAAAAAPSTATSSKQPYQVPGAGTNPTPAAAAGYKTGAPTTGSPANATDQAEAKMKLEKDLTVWKEQFKQWTDQRLSAPGVTMDAVRKDGPTAEALNKALSNVAVAAQSGNPDLENSAVEEYLNLAIAGIQAYVNNSQQSAAPARGAVAAGGAPQDENEMIAQIQQQLEKLGITKSQLTALGTLLAQLNGGKTNINDTGNPALNAIINLTGLKVQ